MKSPAETDPKELYEKPPFDEPRQGPPGLEAEMRHQPDHGEESYRGYGRLLGKAALITGGDSGIGKAVAIAFAREGANVAIAYLAEDREDAHDTAGWIRDAGCKALEFADDIREDDYCRRIVEETAAEFGRFDILVNNAAYQSSHEKLEEFTAEEWDRRCHWLPRY